VGPKTLALINSLMSGAPTPTQATGQSATSASTIDLQAQIAALKAQIQALLVRLQALQK